MTVPIRPVTDKLLAALEAAVAPVKVGDGQAPSGSTVTSAPWVELLALGPEGRDGSWADPAEEVRVVYQVRAVGKGREQVDWLLDRVAAVILGRGASGDYAVSLDAAVNGSTPAVAVWMREAAESSGYDAALDLQLPQQADRYRLWLVPG